MKKVILTIISFFFIVNMNLPIFAHDSNQPLNSNLPPSSESEPLPPPPPPSLEPKVRISKNINGIWTQITWQTNPPTSPRDRIRRADQIAQDISIPGKYLVTINFPTGFDSRGYPRGWYTKRYFFDTSAQVTEFLDNY